MHKPNFKNYPFHLRPFKQAFNFKRNSQPCFFCWPKIQENKVSKAILNLLIKSATPCARSLKF